MRDHDGREHKVGSNAAQCRRTSLHGCLVAGGELPQHRSDLPVRKSLLREELTVDHIKPRLLGHWGTSPGLNLIYVHLNRLIKKYDLDTIYMAGPGHGGPALIANVWLEGSYTEFYPDITRDEAGMLRLFRQFSTPGAFRAMSASRRPARSTRVVNSAMCWCTLLAPSWTIGPAGRRHRRRWRSRDRAACGQLEEHRFHQSHP